jgi:hypothetical protein
METWSIFSTPLFSWLFFLTIFLDWRLLPVVRIVSFTFIFLFSNRSTQVTVLYLG